MSVSYSPDEPIAAIATALSPAALGVVRTSGAGAVELLAKVFSRPKALTQAAGNTIVHGWIVDKSGEQEGKAGRRVDEVLVSVFRAPHSFTGEDAAEITCHGGAAVVKAVHRALLQAGFRQAERGEFTFRAYINGKTDLTRAEAVREIIDSRTAQAATRAVLRLSGALSIEVQEVKDKLLFALAGIAAEVEYPEDEGASGGSLDTGALEEARSALQRLERTWKSERLYQDGAKVVLCGAPNAGKSSLFNTLLKEERAIVSPVEGTTRDWIEAWADFAGIPVRLFDTAGLRESADEVEAEGVLRTGRLAAGADVVLYVIDGKKGLTAEDREFLRRHEEDKGVPCVAVWNKADAEGGGRDEDGFIRTSCKTGEGIDEAVKSVAAVLTEGAAGSALGRDDTQAALGSERQHEAVTQALQAVEHALISHEEGYPDDAVQQDIEDALDSLALLTGEVKADDVLESVFSRFCVGK